MFNFRQNLSDTILLVKGGVYYIYNKLFHSQASTIQVPENVEKALYLTMQNLITNLMPNRSPDVPCDLMVSVAASLRDESRKVLGKVITSELEKKYGVKSLWQKIAENFSDIVSENKFLSFVVDMINPFSSEYKVLEKILFWSSMSFFYNLPSILSKTIEFAGKSFCELASQDKYEQCSEHIEEIASLSFKSGLAVSTVGSIMVMHYIAD